MNYTLSHGTIISMKRVPKTLIALTAITAILTPTALSASMAPVLADPAPRSSAPNTDKCDNATTPPSAETTSEKLQPGRTSIAPLPTVDNEFGSCGITKATGFDVPTNTASAWMVFDLDTGAVIATKDPHGRYRPASVIKALIALVAIDELDLSKKVTITNDDVNQEGSAVGFVEGIDYSVQQLLDGLLLGSGNDAASALARALGGEDTTIKKINDLAQELGTVDTYAASYTGLDAQGMSTSVRDLAVIYQAAWQNPVFADTVKKEYSELPADKTGTTFQVWNDNGILMNTEHGIGGKTGFTDDAHHTFVGAKNINGRRIAAVILDTTIDLGRPWEQANKLIDAGYKVAENQAVGSILRKESTILSEESQPKELSRPSFTNPSDNRDTTPRFVILGALVALVVLGALAWMFGKREDRVDR
ncbi:D-alanyl-D-alanine carboxypeptidase family protein [Corynebacterium diphtheriae]|uniref:D-alanyl-D-alanine carboxypeptidase family protein n=1 Tax=Corynebacterium diphtheriae TaxID=1717 RepID=UPI000245B647|nr:serine hydrolase [Corynebacterium diphtheriae]AEX45858.1 D-alanyl-D-alanine carboxypeptidase [Corynebacterium diphtheriae INCA 402]APM36962.1 D-alanyl-D-alanine carboxypeptidase [Corynebacterium diphtheriae]OFI57734.1 D-alanyl-D-alanine carboxypeptidase [Corynebacterium diphtheriae]OJH88665.1 D-alanyl-D-alanine carboxypeptidase [Corynebacterium diphtheriae]OJH91018.1 D-alanyl-D-alanine carboxypeptidase [Corynebacterium diphtheriae]